MNRATTSAHRVFEVLDTEAEVTDRADAIRLTPVRGRVSFEHVTFAYDGVRQVLRDVSFDVAPGNDRAGGTLGRRQDHGGDSSPGSTT